MHLVKIIRTLEWWITHPHIYYPSVLFDIIKHLTTTSPVPYAEYKIQNSLPNAKQKIIVWTPYAQLNHTLNPRIIMGTTMSRSFSDILLLTPSSISMLSVSVTPIAYRSLRTLAHDIFPYRNPIIRWVEIKQVAKEDVHSSAHYIEDTF